MDVALTVGCSRSVVSDLEHGRLEDISLGLMRRICKVLEVQLQITGRWHGADLDRLMSSGHSALHDGAASIFAKRLPEWALSPEVSFSIWGERGVIDILAWHADTRTVLVIELKTEVADINDMVGVVDRKERLATKVAKERGWSAEHVAVWVIVADSRTNRRHLAAHRAMLRNAFPSDGRQMARWLRRPTGTIRALGFIDVPMATPRRRVRASRAVAA